MRKGDIAYACFTSEFWKLTAGSRYTVKRSFWDNGEGHVKLMRDNQEFEYPDVFFHFVTPPADAIQRDIKLGQTVTVLTDYGKVLTGTIVEVLVPHTLFNLQVEKVDGKPKQIDTYPKAVPYHVSEIAAIEGKPV